MRASASIAVAPELAHDPVERDLQRDAATLDGVARGEDLGERALPELPLEAVLAEASAPAQDAGQRAA